jgi:hypothetical protein
MFTLVSRCKRASLIVTSNNPSPPGPSSSATSRRRRDDRPARPPRRDPLPQGRQLPPPRPRPRRPAARPDRRNRRPVTLAARSQRLRAPLSAPIRVVDGRNDPRPPPIGLPPFRSRPPEHLAWPRGATGHGRWLPCRRPSSPAPRSRGEIQLREGRDFSRPSLLAPQSCEARLSGGICCAGAPWEQEPS